jgi:two-component system, chemotaxis family, chemotaxis protein CheY
MAKILIADDSSFMRQLLKDMLGKAGFTDVAEVVNGEEAIQQVEIQKPDLLMLDIIMPKVDGIGVLEKIDSAQTPVLVISAVGQDKMVAKAKSLGAKDYIIKPFDDVKVIAAVKALIKTS